MERKITHGSLFSGIGGFDLASEWMEWENVFHCEWNEFGQKILKHYWPKAISYEDITKTDFTVHRGQIDILTGGFPCQPYSAAGKRLGKEDDRHLWPEMLRAVREIRPTFIVAENVLGLVDWSNGLVFDKICTDLEVEGYEVQPIIIPACGVNAPHRRYRIWFIANRKCNDRIKWGRKRSVEKAGDHKIRMDAEFTNAKLRYNEFDRWPTVPPLRIGDDGLSSRLDGIAFHEIRKESIKGAGNAVVPQLAYQIFRAVGQVLNCT